MTDLLEKTGLDVRPIAGQHRRRGPRPGHQPAPRRGHVAGIRAALLRHRVVFFRGQTLDHATQIRFGRYFGELTYAHPHDDSPPEGFPEIYTVDVQRLRRALRRDRGPPGAGLQRLIGWHSDVTPAINPPFGSILRADVVPDIGGDTTWTNLVAAYEGLSEPLQRLADGLWAEHRYGAGAHPVGGGCVEPASASATSCSSPTTRSCGCTPRPARRRST